MLGSTYSINPSCFLPSLIASYSSAWHITCLHLAPSPSNQRRNSPRCCVDSSGPAASRKTLVSCTLLITFSVDDLEEILKTSRIRYSGDVVDGLGKARS